MLDEGILSQLTPEELQQLMGMGTLDERGQLLQQQLQMADALRQPQAGEHSTGLGAALGGLGDVLRGTIGGIAGKQAMGKMEGLMGQKDAGRNTFLQAFLKGQRGGAAGPMGAGDINPSSLFGLG